ncbi:hypothetical protein Scep_008700 [Stephania cephalantha]|uniref:Alkaline phytoceramidase n=1 Tax=Stephania cephalantha TaxID=152367 RepID=A0AAP0JSB2_9MAGN
MNPKKMMMATTHLFLSRVTTLRLWIGGIVVCSILIVMLGAPKIPHSPKHHAFADMRNFLGVPNTLNVFSNFPFLIVGVLGLVLSLQPNLFAVTFPAEVFGWAFFYAGVAAAAFGSAYYHLNPNDHRFLWDQLPMMLAYASLLSILILERVGHKIGLTCFFALLTFSLLTLAYERTSNDLRLCIMFQLVPSIAIPAFAALFPPKYSHSRYWLWASGVYLLAKFGGAADRKIYGTTHYIISGHSVEHLCLVLVPVLLTLMLMCRSTRIPRYATLPRRLLIL